MVMLLFRGACFTYYLLYNLFWRYIGRTIHIEVEFPEYLLSLMTVIYRDIDVDIARVDQICINMYQAMYIRWVLHPIFNWLQRLLALMEVVEAHHWTL